MSSRASYFKIGLFAIFAVIIAAAAIIVLGAGAIFQRKILAETYFEQSVQGLDVGSPVKFRGVRVGEVEEITLVSREYATDRRYVMVRIALYADFTPGKYETAPGKGLKSLEYRFQTEIERGLRIRLAFQGLTGAAYLETDYLDPERYPPLEIDWKPRYLYCVSASSTFIRFSDSIERIMNSVEQVDFKEISDALGSSLRGLTKALDEADVKTVGEQAAQLLADLRRTNGRINDLLGEREIGSVVSDASATLAAARRVVERSEKTMDQLFADLPETSARIKSLAGKLDATSSDLAETLTRLKRVSRQLDDLVSSQQPNMEQTIENVRLISENLREFSETVKDDPSQILFGRVPPRAGRKK
jgi:phospholipid/cholesterol/gamma-HCH transport system substrate-binding protein/paraquat-inducible protein B